MSPELEREQRLDEVLADYLRAARAGTAPDRQALLAQHPDLARELAEFFADQERFNHLASPLREVMPPPCPGGLRDFGDYEVLGEIARGGMGVVFRARHKGLGRVVALKMLLAGPLASPNQLQRFQREAEAAASLDHPHIVPIYEVGRHDGHPYLSMKMLEGGSLAQAIARGNYAVRDQPSARRAAHLVAVIARAVHHAHQRGILHRDLKPANILLDDEGQPHVADFGLARRAPTEGWAATPRPANGEITPTIALPPLTQTGAVVGTPGYMAPEQASAERGAVTTASDVYGLGAILYDLLTGRAPFRGPSPLDTLRHLLTSEPDRPASINRHIDRDLETICLKCLDKEPARRYTSASDLADDLERYLHGEAIKARPVGALARAWRWARRQPAVAGLMVALIVALSAGFGLVFYQWQRAEAGLRDASEQRDIAEGHRKDAEVKAEKARRAEAIAGKLRADAEARAKEAREERDKALRQTKLADASFHQAHSAVNNFCLFLSYELRDVPHLQPMRMKLLRAAQLYYRGFLKQRGNDPTLRQELAKTHELVAEIASATGSRQEALAARKQALALYRDLHREAPANLNVRRKLAGTLINVSTLQDVKSAIDSLQEARALYERFISDAPGDLDLARGLSNVEHNLGVLLSRSGKPREGLDYYARALDHQRRLAHDHPDHELVLAELALTLSNLGAFYGRQPRSAALSSCYYLAGLEVRQRLANARPGDAHRQAELAASLHALAISLRDLGQKEEHLEALKQALAIRQKLASERPLVTRYQIDLAATWTSLGHADLHERRWEQALAHYEKARDILARLVRVNPGDWDWSKALADSYYCIGRACGGLGPDRRPAEESAYTEARRLQKALLRARPNDLLMRRDLGRTLNNLAYGLKAQNQFDRARAVAREAIANSRALVRKLPQDVSHRQLLSTHWILLADIERRAGKAGAAAEAVRQREKLWPNDAVQQYRCTAEFVRAADLVGKDKVELTVEEKAERDRYHGEAMRVLRRAVVLGFNDPRVLLANQALVPLHDRDDFRSLLNELQRKSQKRGPRTP